MKSLSVTKPGIIFGNAITLIGGFFLGSQSHIHLWLLLVTLLGLSLIIAAGCVFNNVIDQDIDRLMERTKNRLLARGLMSAHFAIYLGLALAVIGFLLLILFTNWLTVAAAAVGFIFYVAVYSLWMKRKSVYGTLIGGIAGAVPPVVGYCAATNRFDAGAIILFLILLFWQMPHFYAIAIYRLKDYTAANIPVLPVKNGVPYTKVAMLIYTVIFGIVAIAPTLFGYIGYVYFTTALILSLIWLFIGVQGLKTNDDRLWARKMFMFSILLITILCFAMAIKQ